MLAPDAAGAIAITRRWEEDAERRERFFYTALGGSGTPPALCTPEVVAAVVQQHLECPSAWAIFPIQVEVGHQEQTCSVAAELPSRGQQRFIHSTRTPHTTPSPPPLLNAGSHGLKPHLLRPPSQGGGDQRPHQPQALLALQVRAIRAAL
jgi:hypothetical protein